MNNKYDKVVQDIINVFQLYKDELKPVSGWFWRRTINDRIRCCGLSSLLYAENNKNFILKSFNKLEAIQDFMELKYNWNKEEVLAFIQGFDADPPLELMNLESYEAGKNCAQLLGVLKYVE